MGRRNHSLKAIIDTMDITVIQANMDTIDDPVSKAILETTDITQFTVITVLNELGRKSPWTKPCRTGHNSVA
jgi:hypothetical protein